MRAMRCVLAAVLAAGIVTVVAAQPGGGFGRGGFGGQDVDTLVFTNTALQEDLKVTDAQKEKMKPAVEKLTDLNKKRAEAFPGFGGGGKGKFDPEKAKEFQEESTKVHEEVKKIRDEVLTDAQKKRLHQISIQVMSFNVFNDPEAKGDTKGKNGDKGKGGFGGFGGGFVTEAQKETMKEVQDALKLTDAQKSSIKSIVAEFNKEQGEIFKDAFGGGGGGKGKFDPEKMEAASKKVEKVRKETWSKVEDALDDTQKKTWKDLVGDAFDTSKLRPAPPPKKD